ncbi:hypothetical protein MYX07_06765 [Patescibacteria group bacterium AH-259-L07]|nr:hypothetical protein [Patescibacteria group bacterium AH-259-L07]
MAKEFIIRHFEKCPICKKPMKAEKESYHNGWLKVKYICAEHHKIIKKDIKNFEIKY